MAIPRLTGDDIEEMRRLCDQMRKLAAPGQRREYLNLIASSISLPSTGPEATGCCTSSPICGMSPHLILLPPL
jgi:hypothetical protein